LVYIGIAFNCSAGKIHISEATKSALDISSNSDGTFNVELRGQINVKVSLRRNKRLRVFVTHTESLQYSL